MNVLVALAILGVMLFVIVLIAALWLRVNFGIGRLTGTLMRWPTLGVSVVAAEVWLISTLRPQIESEGGFEVISGVAFLGWLIGFLTAAGPFYEKRASDALVAGLLGLSFSLGLGVPGAVGFCLGVVVALDRRCTPATLVLFFGLPCLCCGPQLLPSLLVLAGLAVTGRRVFWA